MYGSGDAVIGINPASDNVPNTIAPAPHALDTFRETLSGAHPDMRADPCHKHASRPSPSMAPPSTLVFQSVAGTGKGQRRLRHSTSSVLQEAQQAALEPAGAPPSLSPAPLPTSCTLRPARAAPSPPTPTSASTSRPARRAPTPSRAGFAPLLVNTVVGFIGPEYLYDGKQILRAGLEDHFCGKLLGLPMGCDVCYTNHAEADQNDMDSLLTLLGVAGVNFVMGVPGADDIMLNYQSTSFHDALYVREALGLSRAPEFEIWLQQMGITGEDGRLLPPHPRNQLLQGMERDLQGMLSLP